MQRPSEILLKQIELAIASNQLILPSLPEVAVRVRAMTADPDCDSRTLEREISQDAAIAGRLIKVANSSIMQRGVPLNSVSQAVARLGLQLVRSLVTQLAILQAIQKYKGGAWLRDFVDTAQSVSAICHGLVQKLSHLDAEQAALVGLVHDIGRLPLREYLVQHPELAADGLTPEQIEDALHPAVGAALLRHWRFSEELIEAVAEHEQVQRAGAARADYADVVIAANFLHHGVMTGPYSDYHDAQIPALRKCGQVQPQALAKVAAAEVNPQRLALLA